MLIISFPLRAYSVAAVYLTLTYCDVSLLEFDTLDGRTLLALNQVHHIQGYNISFFCQLYLQRRITPRFILALGTHGSPRRTPLTVCLLRTTHQVSFQMCAPLFFQTAVPVSCQRQRLLSMFAYFTSLSYWIPLEFCIMESRVICLKIMLSTTVSFSCFIMIITVLYCFHPTDVASVSIGQIILQQSVVLILTVKRYYYKLYVLLTGLIRIT